jgi:hypothetical protein
MSKDDSFVPSSVVPEGSYLKNKDEGLKNFKAFGTYVKKNVEGYLDKLATTQGLQDEILGGSGLSGVGGIAATFIGKGAKGYDEAADRLAQELHDQGVDPREIWRQTGVRRWASGNRQEISDIGLKPNFTTFKDPKLKHWNETKRGYKPIDYDTALDLYTKDQGKNVVSTTSLGDLIQHDELFSNYPQLKKTRVQIDPLYDAKTAAYSLDDNTIYISPEDFYKGDMSSLLHEIQHNIQDIEKWQSGGNPKDFKAYETLMPRVSDKGDINFYNPFELYRRLPGEIEARNTQTRQFMTDAERRAAFPDDTAAEVPFAEMKVHKRKYGVKK